MKSRAFLLSELTFSGGGWASEAKIQDGNSQAKGPPFPPPACHTPRPGRAQMCIWEGAVDEVPAPRVVGG